MGIPSDPQLMGGAEAHPIPTLLSAVTGQEVTALTPVPAGFQKEAPGRERPFMVLEGTSRPSPGVSKAKPHKIPSLPTPPLLRLHLLVQNAGKRPGEPLGARLLCTSSLFLPPRRPACYQEVPAPAPPPPPAWAGRGLSLQAPKGSSAYRRLLGGPSVPCPQSRQVPSHQTHPDGRWDRALFSS